MQMPGTAGGSGAVGLVDAGGAPVSRVHVFLHVLLGRLRLTSQILLLLLHREQRPQHGGDELEPVHMHHLRTTTTTNNTQCSKTYICQNKQDTPELESPQLSRFTIIVLFY